MTPPSWRQLSFRISSGLTIAAQAMGQASNPVKVLAGHGWLDNSATWEELAPRLFALNHAMPPSQRIELVCFDFAGHGWSSHRPPGVFSHFPDYASDILDLADCLGWKKFHLVGHSMGGGVASLVAATVPDRILTLSMIEIMGPVGSQAQEIAKTILQHIASRRKAATKRKPTYSSLQEAIEARSRGTYYLTPKASMLLTRRGIQWADEVPTPGHGIDLPSDVRTPLSRKLTWRTDQRLTLPSLYRIPHEASQEVLRHIKCPVLAVLGTEGLFKSDIPSRVNAIENLELHQIRGGHHLHLEEADAQPVAEYLHAFLTKHHHTRLSSASESESTSASASASASTSAAALSSSSSSSPPLSSSNFNNSG